MRVAAGYALLVAVAAFVAWLLSDYAPGVVAMALVPSFPFRCADCGEDLHVGMRKRRRIPRRGGKQRVVCLRCARKIDEQATLSLDVEPAKAAHVA